MEPDNPYKTPASDIGDGTILQSSSDGQGSVTRTMINELAATKPWVRLCSIMGFIGSGFMVVAGFGVAVLGLVGGVQGSSMGAESVGLGIAYILMSLLYVMPSLYLFRYAGSIQRLLNGGGEREMETALGHQRRFWKFVGVMFLVVLALYVLIIIAAVIFAIFAGASAMRAGGGGG